MATTPTFTITLNTGYLTLTVTSSGSDSFVYVLRNGVYISKTVPTGTSKTFTDYSVPFNTVTSYQVIAVDGSGGQAASTIQSTTLALTSGSYLHQVTKSAQTNLTGTLLYVRNMAGQLRASELSAEQMIMPSRTKPVIELGAVFQDRLEVPTIFDAGSSDLDTLDTFIKSRGVFCFRDSRGSKFLGTFPPQSIDIGFLSSMTIALQRTDYSEAVE